MPAIIPGFEYDIFISYRQKDNKGEKWVAEFVEALTTELDATFKDDIAIYFDENPHHGLLEVHDVDDSLRDKLRCLVFIPIISQTYCDPRSFAWRCEFMEFKRLASSDKFGLKVRVANGNVISRILPVRIHELDAADRQLVENEIGPMRSIDFIFRSAGVNRPLRLKDDELALPRQVLYRDQINKLANAIKEVIQGLKHGGQEGVEQKSQLLTHPFFKDIGQLPKTNSLAVLSFTNETGDPSLEYLPVAISELIGNKLSSLKDLKMPSKAFFSQLKKGDLEVYALAKKMSVDLLLEGKLLMRKGNTILQVTMNNPAESSVVWKEDFDIKDYSPGKLPGAVILPVLNSLEIKPRGNEKKLIDQTPACRDDVFHEFLKGKYLLKQGGDALLKSLELFQKVVKSEPGFPSGHAALASNLILLAYLKKQPYAETIAQAKAAAFKALELDPSLPEGYHALAFICMSYEWNWQEAESVFKKIYSVNPMSPRSSVQYTLGLAKIKSILEEAESESIVTVPYFLPAFALLHLGMFEEALRSSLEALEKEPDSFMAHRAAGLSYLGLEKYDQATKSLETALRLSNQHSAILLELMGACLQAGKRDEAKSILEETIANANLISFKISDHYKFI
jgi:tetratricopeptide (TPR) repeat protein